MHELKDKKRGKAVLVGIQLPDVEDHEHESSMAELGRLVTTLGFEVVANLSQKRKSPHPGTVIGEGKLEELSALTQEDEQGNEALASIVVFDCDISPNQLQNIETATQAEVLDRTGVIVEIFSRHAQTREAKLQVEIAKLNYMAPRLRASRVGGDRQGGGIGGRGAGESAHELDKRRIRDRISELRRQLTAIAGEHDTRRARRSDSDTVALVGYTNAGKSSLMRALTGSEVLVADKLFATLDTTVRPLHPLTSPRILISDTVGFIKKLPHDLVASFRSTLEEALNASLLLYVVDASDPTFRSQLEVTQQVLGEIGATKIDHLLVLNKMDRLTTEQIETLKSDFPSCVMISTKNPDDVKRMHTLIQEFFERDMTERGLKLGHDQISLIGKIRSMARIIHEEYDENGVDLKIKISESAWNQLQAALGKSTRQNNG